MVFSTPIEDSDQPELELGTYIALCENKGADQLRSNTAAQ